MALLRSAARFKHYWSSLPVVIINIRYSNIIYYIYVMTYYTVYYYTMINYNILSSNASI